VRFRHIQPKKSKAALTGFASPVTATTNFLAPDILNKCGRAVSRHFPTLSEGPRRLTTRADALSGGRPTELPAKYWLTRTSSAGRDLNADDNLFLLPTSDKYIRQR
jgi:hypothetical protein